MGAAGRGTGGGWAGPGPALICIFREAWGPGPNPVLSVVWGAAHCPQHLAECRGRQFRLWAGSGGPGPRLSWGGGGHADDGMSCPGTSLRWCPAVWARVCACVRVRVCAGVHVCAPYIP